MDVCKMLIRDMLVRFTDQKYEHQTSAILSLRISLIRSISIYRFMNSPPNGKCCLTSDPLDIIKIYPNIRISIKYDYDTLGAESIRYLVELINNPETSTHQRVLMPQLISRQSTRAINSAVLPLR